MKFTYSDKHNLHAPHEIVVRGMVAPNLETPDRSKALHDALLAQGHEMVNPGQWEHHFISQVHDLGYLEFLQTAHQRWMSVGKASPTIQSHAYAHHSHRTRPSSIQGQVGYYLSGGSCPMVEGTWPAALASAHCALEASRIAMDTAGVAYALCRPPGHHAYADFAGGFCYLNNAAIAANYLAHRVGRVAIIDIDTHHGNGTQSIFYERNDVLFTSVHGDPNQLFPFYAGYENERGAGKGQGFNINAPVPMKSQDDVWLPAVARLMRSIINHSPAALVVSLGFDAFKGDPSSDLAVSTEGFYQAGKLIGAYRGPVVLVQEGGYLVEMLATNLQGFLSGLEQGRTTTLS